MANPQERLVVENLVISMLFSAFKVRKAQPSKPHDVYVGHFRLAGLHGLPDRRSSCLFNYFIGRPVRKFVARTTAGGGGYSLGRSTIGVFPSGTFRDGCPAFVTSMARQGFSYHQLGSAHDFCDGGFGHSNNLDLVRVFRFSLLCLVNIKRR
jgi:hypothetical protein